MAQQIITDNIRLIILPWKKVYVHLAFIFIHCQDSKYKSSSTCPTLTISLYQVIHGHICIRNTSMRGFSKLQCDLVSNLKSQFYREQKLSRPAFLFFVFYADQHSKVSTMRQCLLLVFVFTLQEQLRTSVTLPNISYHQELHQNRLPITWKN